MKELRLIRVADTGNASFGALCIDNIPVAVTLEDAWRDNEPRVSAIPPGNYRISLRQSPRFGLTYEVEGVPGRSHILFHAGNTEHDTHGCILLGTKFGEVDGRPAILGSQVAVQKFMKIMNREPGRLTIWGAAW